MTADVRIYSNRACTKELIDDESGNSVLVLSPLMGVNGYTGEKRTTTIYLKNIGNRAALNVSLYNNDDSYKIIRMSMPDGTSSGNTNILFIGDIPVNGIKTIYITESIPRGTKNTVYCAPLLLDYYSLPTMDYIFYNPYHKDRYKSASKYRILVRELPILTDMFSPRMTILIDGKSYTLDEDNTLTKYSIEGD